MGLFTRLLGKEESPDQGQERLRDTQIDASALSTCAWPEVNDESVLFEGTAIPLVSWVERFKDEQVFVWSLPEIDHGEPRYPSGWSTMRTPQERARIEAEYLTLSVKYLKTIFGYIQAKRVALNRDQYATMGEAIVWLAMAKKHKLLRREFVALADAMMPRLQAELRAAAG